MTNIVREYEGKITVLFRMTYDLPSDEADNNAGLDYEELIGKIEDLDFVESMDHTKLLQLPLEGKVSLCLSCLHTIVLNEGIYIEVVPEHLCDACGVHPL